MTPNQAVLLRLQSYETLFRVQWLVSGHWRKQFYRSTGEHRPKWIEPYVKGSEDQPLKPPTETVFRVSR
jgi:hypothetical protein